MLADSNANTRDQNLVNTEGMCSAGGEANGWVSGVVQLWGRQESRSADVAINRAGHGGRMAEGGFS